MRSCLLLLLLLSGLAQATDTRWVGPPLYWSKFTPKMAPCTFDAVTSMGTCGWKAYPATATMGRVDSDGNVMAGEVSLTQEVTCVSDICNTYYDEPQGSLSDFKGTTYWTVPVGYYLTMMNGQPMAVKYGNGPLADHYPMRDIKIVDKVNDRPDGHYLTLKQTRGTYNVHCNAAGDCSYMGNEVNWTGLPGLIPKVLTANCSKYLCFDPSGRVAGANVRNYNANN